MPTSKLPEVTIETNPIATDVDTVACFFALQVGSRTKRSTLLSERTVQCDPCCVKFHARV